MDGRQQRLEGNRGGARREWKKRRSDSAHTMQQGAYDKQREKRKGEERKLYSGALCYPHQQWGNGSPSSLVSSSRSVPGARPCAAPTADRNTRARYVKRHHLTASTNKFAARRLAKASSGIIGFHQSCVAIIPE